MKINQDVDHYLINTVLRISEIETRKQIGINFVHNIIPDLDTAAIKAFSVKITIARCHMQMIYLYDVISL